MKNCIEHTPSEGSVRIKVEQNNLATEITIVDTGEGIDKEHLPYIFKRFYKAPGASNSSVGIGLSMSKQIIMRQNGNITVESEVGKGSAFLIIYQYKNKNNYVNIYRSAGFKCIETSAKNEDSCKEIIPLLNNSISVYGQECFLHHVRKD